MVWRQIDGRWQNVKDSTSAPISSPNEVNKPTILIQSLSSPGMPQSLPVRPTIKKGGELEEVGGGDGPVVISPSVGLDYNKTTDFVSSKKLLNVAVIDDELDEEEESTSNDVKPQNLFNTNNKEPVKEENTKNVLTIPLQKDESDLETLRAKIDEYVTQRESCTFNAVVSTQSSTSDVEDEQPSTTTEEAGEDDVMPTNTVEEVEQLLPPAIAADNDDDEEIEEQLLIEDTPVLSDKEEVPQDTTEQTIEGKDENEQSQVTTLTKGLAALSTNQVSEGRDDKSVVSSLPEAEPTEPDVYERESEIVREGSSMDQLDVDDDKSTDQLDVVDDKPVADDNLAEDTPQSTENKKSGVKSNPNNPSTSMKQLKEDVEKLRDRYNQSITESGEESYESINAGTCLATALHKTRQITQAERLLEELALISRRTYGFDNDLTQIVESNLQNVKIRYVCVEESEGKTLFYQALRYDDDGTTLIVRGPLNGPLAYPLTNIPDSDIKSFRSKDVIPGPGTPVICYKPGHKKGRMGEVRTREETSKLKVQFADKSIRTLKQENVRVLFELPVKEVPPPATREVVEKTKEEEATASTKKSSKMKSALSFKRSNSKNKKKGKK